MLDVTIIGGGPAGCKAAALLAKDLDVLVMEEHDVSGSPIQCTGLISDDVMELSGVSTDILNSLYGANVFFPDGNEISVRSKKRKAVLIDRSELDRNMAYAAEDSGAKFIYGSRYHNHSVSNGIVTTIASQGPMISRMIVGADGWNSSVSRVIGNNEAKEYVHGIQVDIRHRMDDQDMIDIHVGSEIAPGFFAWLIPFGDMTRVGLCASYNSRLPSDLLKSLLIRTGLDGKTITDKHCGAIPLGGRRTTYSDNVLLIGDAAGQVKPISGGGLYPAFRSAGSLVQTVKEAFEENDLSERTLKRYEVRWKKEIGKGLRNGYRLRKMFLRMNDSDLNRFGELACKESVTTILNDTNIDDPGAAVTAVMKNIPVAVKAMPILASVMLRGRT